MVMVMLVFAFIDAVLRLDLLSNYSRPFSRIADFSYLSPSLVYPFLNISKGFVSRSFPKALKIIANYLFRIE